MGARKGACKPCSVPLVVPPTAPFRPAACIAGSIPMRATCAGIIAAFCVAVAVS